MEQIPLRNRKGGIVDYALVSEQDYDHLSQFKWYKGNGYAVTTINSKKYIMHRYIIIEILKNDLTSKQPVDHINGNPLDNTRANLRLASSSENSQNQKKREGVTSAYNGVHFDKKSEKWRACITANNKKLRAIYDNELHAAWQINIWIDEYELKFISKNKIEEPVNFILYKARTKNGDFPKGISRSWNNFKVSVDRIYYGTFDKLEDAKIKLEAVRLENERIKNEKLLETPILYNTNGDCIFKIKKTEVIIDEDIYHDIIKYKWYVTKFGYVNGYVNGKVVRLHRFIMGYTGDDCIDHIDSNKFNNSKKNLRITTAMQNSMNKKSTSGSSSQYIGVSLNKNTGKWTAQITIKGKQKHLGSFTCEIDAAKARDVATKEHFDQYGKLNFPEN
ncbi:MAG: HNH endonuclease [Cetobacterium sp.]